LANTKLFTILSSGETKQAIVDRSPITGSDAYEDVLKKQGEAFCYRFESFKKIELNLAYIPH